MLGVSTPKPQEVLGVERVLRFPPMRFNASNVVFYLILMCFLAFFV